jgi:hypothetical protein
MYTVSRTMLTSFYKVSLSVPQLFNVDFRVRQQIFQCLRRLVDDTRADDPLGIYEETCLQLALCYKMGFGVRRSELEAAKTLGQSHNDIVRDQLLALKASRGQGYNLSAVYGSFFARGLVAATIDVQYYREKNLLSSILAVNKEELEDWDVVLGPSHWIVLEKPATHQVFLENIGLLDEAESLAQDMFDKVSRILPETDSLVRRQKSSLGRALYLQGKLSMAKKMVKEVIQDSKKDSFNEGNDAADTNDITLLACIYAGQGKMKNAVSLTETLVKKLDSKFGPNHIYTLVERWNLCSMVGQVKKTKKAISLTEDLLHATILALGEEHELSVLVKIGLATMRWERRTWPGGFNGSRDDGTLRMDHIKNSQMLLGNDHPFTLELLKVTVKNLVMKARFPEAIALQEEVVRLSERRPGPTHFRTLERKRHLKMIQQTFTSYRVFQKISTINIGQYVVTPSFRVRHGFERIFWPLYKKKEEEEEEFRIDLSIGLDEAHDS